MRRWSLVTECTRLVARGELPASGITEFVLNSGGVALSPSRSICRTVRVTLLFGMNLRISLRSDLCGMSGALGRSPVTILTRFGQRTGTWQTRQSKPTGRNPRPWRSRKKATSSSSRAGIGPVYPKTPACYGFTLIAKVKPGCAAIVRAYGKKIEDDDPRISRRPGGAELHYLRWVLFDNDTRLLHVHRHLRHRLRQVHRGRRRAVQSTGITTIFEQLEGFPEDWRTNPPAFVQFVREHQRRASWSTGSIPYVSADEIMKALKMKAALSDMLDQMQ